MSDQILKFGDAEINEKKCHASKQHSDNGSKYFIASEEDDIIRPLCIALPQMSRHIKHFDNGGKNMSFNIEDYNVLVKYNVIWNKI